MPRGQEPKHRPQRPRQAHQASHQVKSSNIQVQVQSFCPQVSSRTGSPHPPWATPRKFVEVTGDYYMGGGRGPACGRSETRSIHCLSQCLFHISELALSQPITSGSGRGAHPTSFGVTWCQLGSSVSVKLGFHVTTLSPGERRQVSEDVSVSG